MALLWLDTLWSSMLGRHTERHAQEARRSRSVLWTHRLPDQRNCDATACHFPSLVTSVIYISDCCVFVLECVLFYDTTGWHLLYSIYFHATFISLGLSKLYFPRLIQRQHLLLKRCLGLQDENILLSNIASFMMHYIIGGQEISLNVKSYQLPHE